MFQPRKNTDSHGFVPAHLGECVRECRPGQWQTMTVEYWNDKIFAHLSDNEFVIGRHPIVDRTRKYFAYQFDLPDASIDFDSLKSSDAR